MLQRSGDFKDSIVKSKGHQDSVLVSKTRPSVNLIPVAAANRESYNSERFRMSFDDRYRMKRQNELESRNPHSESTWKELENANKRNTELVNEFKTKYN